MFHTGKAPLPRSRGPPLTGCSGHRCLRVSPHKARHPPTTRIEGKLVFLTVSCHTNPLETVFYPFSPLEASRKWNLTIAAACVRSLSLLSCLAKTLRSRGGSDCAGLVSPPLLPLVSTRVRKHTLFKGRKQWCLVFYSPHLSNSPACHLV